MTQAMAVAAIAVALLASTAANAAPNFQHQSGGAPQIGAPAHSGGQRGGFGNNPHSPGVTGSRGNGSQPPGGSDRPHPQHIGGYNPYRYPDPFYSYPPYIGNPFSPALVNGDPAYCSDPPGYYPNVTYCNVPWE